MSCCCAGSRPAGSAASPGAAAALLATLTSLVLAATGLAFVDLGGPGDLAAGGLAALAVVLPPAVVTLVLAVSDARRAVVRF